MLNVVLVEPEIPQNTGNIARTCACTHTRLHLVRPFGFEISDRTVKRAGLDYWDKVDITYYDSLDEFMERNAGAPMFYATTKAKKAYVDVSFPDGAFILFGKETKGLPEPLLDKYYDRCVRLPMKSETRSLNLSNSVCVGVYEALRQNDYEGLKTEGELTGRGD